MIDADPDLVFDALRIFPPSVSKALTGTRDFQIRFPQIFDGEITFGSNEASFVRSVFFSSMRTALSSLGSTIPVADRDGASWDLTVHRDGEARTTILRRDASELMLPDFWALSADAKDRMQSFERWANDCNLQDDAARAWRALLDSGPITDEAHERLLDEYRFTPVGFARFLAKSIEDGKTSINALVPTEKRFYDRLIGQACSDATLEHYANGVVPAHTVQLIEWHEQFGLQLSFLLCGHAKISYAIAAHSLKREALLATYEGLASSGDRISQTGAVEVGLYLLDTHPELEPFLIRIIKQIRDDNLEDEGGRPVLLSTLIAFVAGTLARRKTLESMPPFWRRQAAIAHASLIERQLVEAGINVKNFTRIASAAVWQFFYLEGLIDLRLEPRWHPDFISPDQIKAELMSRLVNAANLHNRKIISPELRTLLLGEDAGSIKSYFSFPTYCYPGFLEGGSAATAEIPRDIVEKMEAGLNAERLDGSSFAFLVNYSRVARFEPEHATIVANALRRVKYHVDLDIETKQDISLIMGLATIAAASRSVDLANEVRVLARIHRQKNAEISIELALKIATLAAASRPSFDDWATTLGDWLTELAFNVNDLASAEQLSSLMRRLCQICPALWKTCSKADSALSLLIQSKA